MSNQKPKPRSAGGGTSAPAEPVEVVVMAATLIPPGRKDLTEASVLDLPVLPGTCLPNCPPAGRPTPAGFLCPIGASFDPAISMVDPLCIHLEVVRRSARPGGHLSGAVGKGVKMRPKRRFSPTNSPLLRLDHPDGQSRVELYS